MKLDEQSIIELEFDKVKELLASQCKSEKAKNIALNINGFNSVELLQIELDILQEIQRIHGDDAVSLPHPNSEDIDHALKLLHVENGVLILDELIKVYQLCIGTKELVDFSVKHKQQFPLVFDACAHITSVKDVLDIIQEILNSKLEIKDDATPYLKQLRDQQKANERIINRNFDRVLSSYKKDEVIGDIEETFIENRRLLSVISSYKKRVQGKVYGMSARGTYTYIEPEINVELNKRQEKLRIEESNELFKILKEVTDKLRGEKRNLEAFQRLLVRFDVYNAKVIFASEYEGVRPKINKERKMYWLDAKHPLLYIKHQELNEKTIGQEIELSQNSRFLVISGPNAGGKSITLKTVGLLQMMFQCGLFVPVNDVSSFCWFGNILSDIGDNQSIDNQLSTYSYRLSRMNQFLSNVDDSTLLLLDEFGSGSDPELGGALAEVFYEKLYEKNCFAVITTHYTNIKILTSNLDEAVNACMLFDTRKLIPLYQLSVGQPGSSFTFEVAKLNGIEENIIKEAKERVSKNKIQVDELAVALQKEKSRFKKVNSEQYKKSSKASQTIREYEAKLERLTAKSDQQIQYFEQQNKYVNTGKKIYDFIKKYKSHKTNKALAEAVKKFVVIEKNKILQKEKPVVFNTKLKAPDLPKSSKDKINKTKQTSSVKIKEEVVENPIKPIAVGDKVKLKNYNQLAEVKKIKGDKIEVLVGNFMISTTTKEIEN